MRAPWTAILAAALVLVAIDAASAGGYRGVYRGTPLSDKFPRWHYVADFDCPHYSRRYGRWYHARCTYPWPYMQF